METITGSPFAAWESFYVIVGSSAGALTGLQFVVVALSADSRVIKRTELAMLAFGAPTIVHFCAVLLMAAVLSTPWTSLSGAEITLAITGAAGVGYTGIVIRRALQPGGYTPVFEDWLWHAAFPGLAYASQFIAAVQLPDHPGGALLVIGGASLLLLFSGIHNAWDAAMYIALATPPVEPGAGPASSTTAPSAAPQGQSSTPPGALVQ